MVATSSGRNFPSSLSTVKWVLRVFSDSTGLRSGSFSSSGG